MAQRVSLKNKTNKKMATTLPALGRPPFGRAQQQQAAAPQSNEELAIRTTQASWLSRIMSVGGATRQLALSAATNTLNGSGQPQQPDSFRTCTPLRPNASLVERVATPTNNIASGAG